MNSRFYGRRIPCFQRGPMNVRLRRPRARRPDFKRAAWGCALLLLGLPTTAEAADFDPALNGLRIETGALRGYDFEAAEGLVGLELAEWAPPRLKLERKPITAAAQVADRLTSAADAIEGAHALRLGAGKGLVIADETLFGQIKDGRFELSLWARADGQGPILQVVYDRDPAKVYDGDNSPFALVRGIRTGRETSDGWAEYSTGPLDGSIWGVPVVALLVLPPFSSTAPTDKSFLVDALEIRTTAGKAVSPSACTQANVDKVCGAEGDCIFGHCVSSTVTWGVNPPPAHREQIAERWVQFGTRFIGDRNAAKNGAKILAPEARELAKSAPSSRQFFGGLNRLVNLLRDNHTTFGSPSNFTNFAPQIQQGSSSVMGACFGVVEKDIMDGGLGFAVFRASDAPLSGTPLKPGDVLVAIDGLEPKAWVDANWPRFATTLPNDPRSDWGAVAGDLSSLITARASSVKLARCKSAAACAPADRQQITIDIGTTIYDALTSPEEIPSGSRFACSQRFTNSVTPVSGTTPGEDPVFTEVGAGGETRVQFDGFVGQTSWQSSMSEVFSGSPARVLMDARMGHGGFYSTVEYLFHLLRGTSEPMGVFSVGRGSYDMSDPPWLFTRFSACAGSENMGLDCYGGSANGFFAKETAPVGAETKIAWLNTRDVSANDFMPRLLKGRTGFRIFAPHPTSGAFGSVVPMPAVASGWSGTTMQIQDARFAPSIDAVEEARWESGHGVEPDVVVVQKLSDALSGVDTILAAATAWLASP